jgi:hypothetical protein
MRMPFHRKIFTQNSFSFNSSSNFFSHQKTVDVLPHSGKISALPPWKWTYGE